MCIGAYFSYLAQLTHHSSVSLRGHSCLRSSFVAGIHRPQEAIRSFPIRERERRAHFPDGTRLALYSETGSGRSGRTAPRLHSRSGVCTFSSLRCPRERYSRYRLYCPFNRKNQSFPNHHDLYVISRDISHVYF